MDCPSIVLLCGAGYVSGKEIVALELAKGLMARGVPPYVVASSWNDGDFIHRLSEAGIDYELMPTGFISAKLTLDCLRMTGEQVLKWPRLLWSYRNMLRRERPTIIVHTNWHHLLLLWPFLSPHRDFFWLHECVPNSPRYRSLYHRLARRIGKFICVSAAVARSLFDLGIAAEKVEVVHNGLSDCASEFLTGRPINCDALNIGIVGQVGAWKGHNDLFTAFASVICSHPNARLHIYGTGKQPFLSDLHELANRLEIGNKIEWHGFVKNRGMIYSNLDVCVVPSHFEEPFGLSAVEPGYFGIPVIATRKGGLPEIVINNETGLVVEAGSPDQLSTAICRLLDQPQLRQQMGIAARLRATTHFSQQRFIDDFLRILSIDVPELNRAVQPLAANVS